MEGRTKPIVDAIVWSETSNMAGAVFVEYQPGNGTRYACVFVQLDLGATALPLLGFARQEPDGVFMFTWLNRSRGGCCHVFRDCGYLAPAYVAEKLDCGMADAVVLAELIAHYTNRTADSALESRPPPCSACAGAGKLIDADGVELCPDCNGEGVRRASSI